VLQWPGQKTTEKKSEEGRGKREEKERNERSVLQCLGAVRA
jgi:hypothetical protein